MHPQGGLLSQEGKSGAQGSDVDGLVGALVPEDEHQPRAEMQEAGG